jgi:hypothetical protein
MWRRRQRGLFAMRLLPQLLVLLLLALVLVRAAVS